MKLKERIEGILQKYGVATKMVTTGSTNDPISTWYTQDLAVELIEELSQLLQGNGEKYNFTEIQEDMKESMGNKRVGSI